MFNCVKQSNIFEPKLLTMIKAVSLFGLLLTISIIINSCSKVTQAINSITGNDSYICDSIAKIKIRGAKASYYVGDPISLSVSDVPNVFYTWTSSSTYGVISNSASFSLSSCTKEYQGWFYVSASNSNCTTHVDSVYITIQNKPVTPPCSPTNNTLSFSGVADFTFSNPQWGTNPSFGQKDLSVSTSSGDFDLMFNPYWNTKEPEDGVYTITNTPTFLDASSVYTVYMSLVSQSIYFSPNNTTDLVYVTHQNGKIQATFCSVKLSGSLGGPSYTTTAVGKLTAP